MLIEIMNYTQVADKRIIKMFEQSEFINPKALSLFSHILNAQHIWANRIMGKVPVYGVWQEHSKKDFCALSDDNFKLFASIFEEVDLVKEVKYRNASGDTYTNVVQEILFHAFNHSTYHRGQIATLFKVDGNLPPITDYIILKREMHL